jgi:hypothetical protein
LAKKYPKTRVIMECGAQSAWISRFLVEFGMEAIVATARKVRAIRDGDSGTASRGQTDWTATIPPNVHPDLEFRGAE